MDWILKKALTILRSLLKVVLITIGCIGAMMIILAFTIAPYRAWYGMSLMKSGITRTPDIIVVLGGGGMPSASDLMRCWYGSALAKRFPGAKIIVALPGDDYDSLSSVNQMKQELILRGVSPERILLENSGTNTRAEALNVMKIVKTRLVPTFLKSNYQCSILLVTSPEHMLRAILTFEKVGFRKTDGMPAFENVLEGDLSFIGKNLGGRGWLWDIGNNIKIRYEFWIQMNYELLVIRESLAIFYYKLQGWV